MSTDNKKRKQPIEQDDLFLCDLASWPIKDDIASMEVPVFCLEKHGSTQTREYIRGDKKVRIIPSGEGAATVFDKDVLIYAVSQIVEAMNQGLPISRTVRIKSNDYLLATKRTNGGAQFARILSQLRRLRGTTIETNIETGGIEQTRGFSLIESYEVTSQKRSVPKKASTTGKKPSDEEVRVIEFEITLSEWLYNGIKGLEVLTLDDGYFKLTRSIDRRIYEIARKHCGNQPFWKISIPLLIEKIGSTRGNELYKVRDEIRRIIEKDHLPEYHIALEKSDKGEFVVFYARDMRAVSKYLSERDLLVWYSGLERFDNVKFWRGQIEEAKRGAQVKPSIKDAPVTQ